MRSLQALVLVVYQLLGYLWYGLVFLVIVPILFAELSFGLDFLILDYWLGIDVVSVASSAYGVVYQLATVLVALSGVVIIVEAVVDLYKFSGGFPFAFITHAQLTPKRLAVSGWYGRVRHPMLLGYGVLLTGVGMFLQSPGFAFFWTPILVFALLYKSVITEEAQLRRWFGDEYIAYTKKVPAIFPRIFRKD